MKRVLIIISFLLSVSLIKAITWNGRIEDYPTKWPITGFINKGKGLESVVADPLNQTQKALKIKILKGSCSSACGLPTFGLNVAPIKEFANNVASLEFQVYFPPEYNFMKGGKLAGIFSTGPVCSGCKKVGRDDCFSSRMNFGPNNGNGGNGYPYVYLPLSADHEKDFCSLAGKCEANCGLGLSPTKWFEKNKWNTVKQRIKLNTIGKKDGQLTVWINGVQKFNYNKMIFRVKDSVKFKGLSIHPFFGGSGPQWAPPADTYILFKNIKFTDY